MVSNVNFWPLLNIRILEKVTKKRYQKGNGYLRTITVLVTRMSAQGTLQDSLLFFRTVNHVELTASHRDGDDTGRGRNWDGHGLITLKSFLVFLISFELALMLRQAIVSVIYKLLILLKNRCYQYLIVPYITLTMS